MNNAVANIRMQELLGICICVNIYEEVMLLNYVILLVLYFLKKIFI